MGAARLDEVRGAVRDAARGAGLVGTVYLAGEGINAFLAGREEPLRAALAAIARIEELAGMEWKESWSRSLPFDKLVVRKKKEIIALGFPLFPGSSSSSAPCASSGSDPSSSFPSSPPCELGMSCGASVDPRECYVEPSELAQWLEEGRDVTLLDTRNDYEWRLGGLRGSIRLPIRSFRDFPRAMEDILAREGEEGQGADQQLCDRHEAKKAALRGRTVVMYCTGGVRCEKAAPLLRQRYGFDKVYQLHGGILKYFEETGNAHYEGLCYVFDKRLALGTDLQPANDLTQCHTCRNPLTAADRASPLYASTTCPYCPPVKSTEDHKNVISTRRKN